MTGATIISAFKQYYDKITNLAAPGYLDAEILLFLNNAQDELVKDRVFGKNFQPPAFEDNQKQVADVQSLIVQVNKTSATVTFSTPTNYPGTNGRSLPMVDIDTQFMFFLNGEAKITRTNPTLTSRYVPLKFVRSDYLRSFLQTGFNRPWYKDVILSIVDDVFYFFPDYYSVFNSDILINYVRKPYPITAAILEYTGSYAVTVMSLPSPVHQEIVDIAVRHALATSQDPRYQSQLLEQQIKQ